jgi:hypothetical protein
MASDRSYLVLAVDPGETWCGLAYFRLFPGGSSFKSGYLDRSAKGQIVLQDAVTHSPERLYRALEEALPQAHHVVLERYSLYPWLAREQGYSELLTAQCVGVVRYLSSRADVPLTQQDAKGNLKEGRALAKKHGFKMKDRVLGSGRFKYRGPDFDLPGRPHRRDAASHGVRWAAKDPSSPLLTARQLPG